MPSEQPLDSPKASFPPPVPVHKKGAVLADCAHAPEKPVRGYDYRLARNLAGREPEGTRRTVSARVFAVNAGDNNGAVSEDCASMKKP
jgi:hypothetical protein